MGNSKLVNYSSSRERCALCGQPRVAGSMVKTKIRHLIAWAITYCYTEKVEMDQMVYFVGF